MQKLLAKFRYQHTVDSIGNSVIFIQLCHKNLPS
jgi:hypothetical protein